MSNEGIRLIRAQQGTGMDLFAIHLIHGFRQMGIKPLYYVPEFSQYQMLDRMEFLKDIIDENSSLQDR